MTPWQTSLSNAITTFSELCSTLELDPAQFNSTVSSEKSFALRAPREFVARIKKGDPNDPLLLQVLPQSIEMEKVAGFSSDPLDELTQNPVPGLLHKYPNRVLLTLTGACAVNCRYCFRRHFPYHDIIPNRANWDKAIDYIQKNNQIDEVILSGGDPLVLKDALLSEFASRVEKIPHVKRLRIHTRLPIVIPSRVTEEWLTWMKQSPLKIIIVIHCNHANEIDEPVLDALKKLRECALLLNQSVLLKNINDTADALVNLSKRLCDADVLPYYLHLLDKVDGSAHFDVSEEIANELINSMKKKLPGYLVPKLARELSGEMHKLY